MTVAEDFPENLVRFDLARQILRFQIESDCLEELIRHDEETHKLRQEVSRGFGRYMAGKEFVEEVAGHVNRKDQSIKGENDAE